MRGRTGRRRDGGGNIYHSSECEERRGLLYLSAVCIGRKMEKRMVMVSLLTVNAERGAFLSPLSPAAKFPEFFPVRLN